MKADNMPIISMASIAALGKENEDYVMYDRTPSGDLVIAVADGMGGKLFGAVASKTACQSIVESVKSNNEFSFQRRLICALEAADVAIADESIGLKSELGTAVFLSIISNSTIFYSWQGNIRLYLERDNAYQCLTRDHTIDTGYGDVRLTRCIKGCGLREDIPFHYRPLEKGDKLIICTDGFYSRQSSLTDLLSDIGGIASGDDDSTVLTLQF